MKNAIARYLKLLIITKFIMSVWFFSQAGENSDSSTSLKHVYKYYHAQFAKDSLLEYFRMVKAQIDEVKNCCHSYAKRI
jgi:hypothetical protein